MTNEEIRREARRRQREIERSRTLIDEALERRPINPHELAAGLRTLADVLSDVVGTGC